MYVSLYIVKLCLNTHILLVSFISVWFCFYLDDNMDYILKFYWHPSLVIFTVSCRQIVSFFPSGCLYSPPSHSPPPRFSPRHLLRPKGFVCLLVEYSSFHFFLFIRLLMIAKCPNGRRRPEVTKCYTNKGAGDVIIKAVTRQSVRERGWETTCLH